MKRSPWYLLCAVGLMLLISVAACADDRGESWERIQQAGVLRIGLDPTYPPFEMADDGNLRGLDVDLARALTAEMGLEAQFTYFGYDGLYDALATEQVDILISALVIAPERSRDFAFSDPYFNAGLVLVRSAGDRTIQVMDDLAGESLAVELGSQGHVEATTWQRQLGNLMLLQRNSPDEALQAVAAGEASAALVDSVSGRLFTRDRAGLEVVEPAVTDEPYAIVVRRRDERLLEAINAALAGLGQSGRLAEIERAWLGSPPPP
jgi:ABC-type amino acid transport substrate-binding protein